jgi:SAM-dependent methyltransferase
MKFSELVAYKNNLSRMTVSEAEIKAGVDIEKIKHLVNSKEFDPNGIKQAMEIKHQELRDKFNDFKQLIEQAKQSVQLEIDLKEQYWLQESYRLYDQEMINDTDEHILNRRPTLLAEHNDIIRARIKNFSNHLHPGLIIRPGLETFIQDMVSFDPLYLVDQSNELLFPAMVGFTEQYRRRLRPYIVSDRDDCPLSQLPDNQFAICLAYNFFNFKPIEIIERYLKDIYLKLKPGGRLMMTFNDCDNEKAVRLAETYYACYTPGKLVKAIAEKIGYDIYFIWNDNTPTTWIELQRPGTLKSLRGGQALAKVVVYPPKI